MPPSPTRATADPAGTDPPAPSPSHPTATVPSRRRRSVLSAMAKAAATTATAACASPSLRTATVPRRRRPPRSSSSMGMAAAVAETIMATDHAPSPSQPMGSGRSKRSLPRSSSKSTAMAAVAGQSMVMEARRSTRLSMVLVMEEGPSGKKSPHRSMDLGLAAGLSVRRSSPMVMVMSRSAPSPSLTVRSRPMAMKGGMEAEPASMGGGRSMDIAAPVSTIGVSTGRGGGPVTGSNAVKSTAARNMVKTLTRKRRSGAITGLIAADMTTTTNESFTTEWAFICPGTPTFK